jgi:hypothetical protein
MMNPLKRVQLIGRMSIDTVMRKSNDECIKLLQAEDDINDIGDGGTSNGEGEGYDSVHSFQDGMKEVERESILIMIQMK